VVGTLALLNEKKYAGYSEHFKSRQLAHMLKDGNFEDYKFVIRTALERERAEVTQEIEERLVVHKLAFCDSCESFLDDYSIGAHNSSHTFKIYELVNKKSLLDLSLLKAESMEQ